MAHTCTSKHLLCMQDIIEHGYILLYNHNSTCAMNSYIQCIIIIIIVLVLEVHVFCNEVNVQCSGLRVPTLLLVMVLLK